MRVRNWLVVGLVLTLATAGFAQTFRLIFSDTDVADVLRSISLRTGANIVYSSAEPLPISINVTVNGAEDAVRAAASAAGLGHRRIGNTFIVASVANMRKAMEPFGQLFIFMAIAEEGVVADLRTGNAMNLCRKRSSRAVIGRKLGKLRHRPTPSKPAMLVNTMR